MVHAFNSGDLFGKLRVMDLNVMHQFQLGIGWTNDEDRSRIGNCFGHFMQISLAGFGVAAAHRIGAMVNVTLWIVGLDHLMVGVIPVEMEYLGFLVVNPDDGMEMGAHLFSPCWE